MLTNFDMNDNKKVIRERKPKFFQQFMIKVTLQNSSLLHLSLKGTLMKI